MAYAQVDDNMTEHPKIERLSDRAFRVYVTSICFASRNLTDGVVLASQAGKVGATPALAKELVDARCWDRHGDGWRVHDYLDWNKSRAEIETFREKQRTNGLASGRARGSTKRQPLVEPVAKPVAEPVGQPSTATASSKATADPAAAAGAREAPDWLSRCIRAFDGLMGSAATTEPILNRIRSWHDSALWASDEQAAGWFEAACEEAAVHNGRSAKYVLAILERWQREGRNGPQNRAENGGKSGLKSAKDQGTETPEARARREEQEASIREFGERQRAWDALSPEQQQAERKARSERWREFAAEHGIATEAER